MVNGGYDNFDDNNLILYSLGGRETALRQRQTPAVLASATTTTLLNGLMHGLLCTRRIPLHPSNPIKCEVNNNIRFTTKLQQKTVLQQGYVFFLKVYFYVFRSA